MQINDAIQRITPSKYAFCVYLVQASFGMTRSNATMIPYSSTAMKVKYRTDFEGSLRIPRQKQFDTFQKSVNIANGYESEHNITSRHWQCMDVTSRRTDNPTICSAVYPTLGCDIQVFRAIMHVVKRPILTTVVPGFSSDLIGYTIRRKWGPFGDPLLYEGSCFRVK